MARNRVQIAPVWLVLLALALAPAGCGDTSAKTATIQRTSKISFGSPGVQTNGDVRPSVSCGGGTLWLPLKWGVVPRGTKELAIYIGRFKYKGNGESRRLVVPFADVISQINPDLHGNASDTLPKGVYWSYFGSVSCPPVRKGQHILQELFALDRAHPREIDPRIATRLTREALQARGRATDGPRARGPFTGDAAGIGRFIATYAP